MNYKEMKKKIVLNILPTTIIGTIIITAPLTTALIFTKIVGENNKLFNFLTKEIIKQEIEKLYPAKNILPQEAIKNQTKTKFTIKSVDIEFKPQGDDAIGKINYEITKINKDNTVHQNPNIFNDELTGYLTQEKKEILVKEVEGLTKNQIYKVINAKFESSKKTHTASQAKTSININKVIINGINVIFNTTADDANEKIIYNITRIYKESVERDKTTLQELDGEITGFQIETTNNDKTIVEAVKADDIKLAIETLFNPHKNKTATQARQVVIPGPDDTIGQFDLGKDNITYKFKVVDTVDANKEIKYEVTEVKKGNQIKDDLTNFKGTIVGFQTQKEIDLVTVNAIDKAKIKTAIEATYPNKGTNLPSATNDDPSVIVDGATVTYTVINDDNAGEKTYTIQSIVLNGTSSNQSLGPLGDKIVGFKTQATADLETVNAIDKAKIKNAIEATYPNKGTNLPSATNDDPSVIVDGATVTYTVINDDNAGEKTYTIQSIVLNGTSSNQSLGQLGDKIVGFKTQATADLETVNAIDKAKIKAAIEATYSNKAANLPSATNDDPSVIVDGATVTYTVIDNDNAGEKTYTIQSIILNGISSNQSLGLLGDKIVGFKTQATADLETVNAIDKAKIKAAIEATYSNKGTNLPSATNDDPSVIVDGAIVTYTVIDNDNAGEKTYTIQSIVLNGTSSNQSLGPLGDKIVGFKTQTTADLETVNAIDKAKIKNAIEATYSNKAANLPSATNDDPSVIVDGATVTYTVINNDNAGEKTYIIQSIVLNGIPSTQSLGLLGDKIVGFKTQATADLETVNAIDKAKIKVAIEATYSNKAANLPSATNDDPSVIVDGATVTYTVINNDNAGEKTYTIQSIILNGISSNQSLGLLGDKIVGFKTQATADLETVNAIDKAKIKVAIEATYSNKGTNLPSATNDDPSVIVDGATVTYTVINNDNAGEKTYTIQSIVLNGIPSTQSLGPLGDKIIGFKTQATADLETVNAIDKAKIKTAIEATYSNKGTNLPSATNDDPSVIVDGATVTYTVINNDNAGEKTYTIQFIVLNGIPSTQSLGPLGDKIVGFKTQALVDLETVNAIDKAKIKAAIEATYSNKGTNLPSATNDDPSVIVDRATVTYTVINDDNAGEKTYTIQSIVLNGIFSTQSLGPLGDKIVGFKTQALVDLETVNAIDKAKIKAAIEATYSNKGTNLPSATNDDPSVIVDGATVTYTVANYDNIGEKTYTIRSITLNGTKATQDLLLLGDIIKDFLTNDQNAVNNIQASDIEQKIKDKYSDKNLLPLVAIQAKAPNIVDVNGISVEFNPSGKDDTGEITYTVTKIYKNQATHSNPGQFIGTLTGYSKLADLPNIISNVTANQVKEIDSVGTQYSQDSWENVVKNLKLINASWVTTANLKFALNKSSDAVLATLWSYVDIAIKQGSLDVKDVAGTIQYIVVFTIKNNNQSIEIPINYQLSANNNNIQFKLNNYANDPVLKGDLSTLALSNDGITTMYGVDVSQIIKWPNDVSGIKWLGVEGLTAANTPFKGDLSKKIINSTIFPDGMDLSLVTKWPTNLSGIVWNNPKGLTSLNTPFQGNIELLDITNSLFDKNIDFSQVTKWPTRLNGINWIGAQGITANNTPFKGDISGLKIAWSNFSNTSATNVNAFLDFSQVTKWPTDIRGIAWREANKNPFQESDLSSFDISSSNFLRLDVSAVRIWPANLSGIIWTGVKGLTAANTPFQGDISTRTIFKSALKDVDVSAVTKWPDELNNIDWRGVVGLTVTNTPFKGDISMKKIGYSILEGIDVSDVTDWPSDYNSANFDGVICTLTTKPPNWSQITWNVIQRNKQ